MRYLFFDTAVNGYYSLTILKRELTAFLPLIAKEENISDDAAPFLFEVNDEKLAQFLSTEHVSFKEILFLESKESLAAIQSYFSRFAVQIINGREFYFRFWSAIVFKKYIVTCNAKQLAEMFRMVDQFIYEDDEAGSAVQYSFDGSKLITQSVSRSTVFHSVNNVNIVPAVLSAQPANADDDKKNNSGQQEAKPKRKFFT